LSWRNWAGDEGCSPAAIERPRSVAELEEVVGRAAAGGGRVHVAGSGHSFSDVACTDGTLVQMDRLHDVLEVDRDSGLVKVEAGITIHELNRRLAEAGLALANLGDIDVQTIAGAISTATHGTGAGLPNISAQVVGMELVTADGSTRTLTAADDDGDLLRAARVGLGALGAIATVTLQAVPAFTLRGVDKPAPLDDALDRLDELGAASDHFEFFTFPHTGVALTRTNNRTDEPPRPRGKIKAWIDDILLNNHAFELACRIGKTVPRAIPTMNRLVTKASGTTTRIDRSDRVFASPRLVRFTEMEYAVPRQHTATAVRRVLEAIDERDFKVPFPLEVRLVAPDDALLSPAHARPTGYVAVHMYRGMEYKPYFEAVEEIMSDLDGRPHWGKRHFQTAQTLAPRYPKWDRFQAIRARLDPDGAFATAHTDRVLGHVRAPAEATP
jgi:L-gulonolactone oxidase